MVFLLPDLNGKLPIQGLESFPGSTAQTSTTSQVRVVYFLTLNGRAIRQVHRLIKALFLQKHYFYIHVDAVSFLTYKQQKYLTK